MRIHQGVVADAELSSHGSGEIPSHIYRQMASELRSEVEKIQKEIAEVEAQRAEILAQIATEESNAGI